MQNNNQQNERVRPKLESASELKGKKAESKSSASIAKKRMMTIISLVLVLAITVGAYFVTDALRPVEEIDPSSTEYTSESVYLVEGRFKKDMASMTVYHNGVEQYTILSNLKEKAEIEAAEEAAAAEAEAVAAETAALEEAAEAAEEVIDNVLGTIDLSEDMQQITNSTAPQMLNNGQTEAETEPGAEELPDPEDLGVGVVLETEEKELQDYEIQGMPEFTTNTSAIDNMVTYSFSIVAGKFVQQGSEDLSTFGLDNPQVQVHFTYHDGTEMTFNIGDNVPTGDYYYMSLDDSTDVYMIYDTVYDYFTQTLEELHNVPAMPAINSEGLVYLLAEQRGKETIEAVLREDTANTTSVSDVYLVQPFEYDVNSERTSETMISAAALSLTAYVDRAADEAALAEFGLVEPYARVKVSDSDDVSIEMTIGDLVEGSTAYRYATVDNTGDIYTVDVSLLSFLDNCRVSYLVDQFAGLINIKRINGFTIETPEKTYTAVVENTPYTDENGNEQVNQEFTFEGEFVEEGIFRDFYTVIIGQMVDKRIENEEEYYFDGDVALRLTYELTYQDEPYVIEYLDYDRDYYAVRRNGVSLFLIRKDKAQEIIDTAELLAKGEYAGIDDTIDYEEVYGDSSYYE